MKINLKKLITFTFLSTLIFSVTAIQFAFAEGKSIGVRPLKNEITIDPGQTISKTISVLNNTNKKRQAIPVLEVFKSSDDSGYPNQMAPGDPNNPQDVTNWVKMSYTPLDLPPFSKTEFEYKITAPENAEPGGHYAALIFQDYDPTPVDAIKIEVRVASLLLVKVSGDMIEEAQIADFALNNQKVFDDQPLSFSLKIKNLGNIHFAPEGRIVIKNSKGEVLKKIGKVINSDGQEVVFDYIPVNHTQGHVLPQSIRDFEGKWDKPVFNEKMTAEVRVAYSDIKEVLSKTIEFKLERALEVSNFKFDVFKRDFTLGLKNSGNVLIKPLGGIKIYNSFDFQVDEIPISPEEDYLKQGEERIYSFNWSKDVPSGRYKAIYEYSGELDNLKSEPIKFIIGNPFLAMLYGWPGLVVAGLLIAIIWAIIVYRKKKKNEEENEGGSKPKTKKKKTEVKIEKK